MCTLTLIADAHNSGTIELEHVSSFQTAFSSELDQTQFECQREDYFVNFNDVDAFCEAQEKTGWLDVPHFSNTLLMPYVTDGYVVCVVNKPASFYRHWKLTTN